MKAVVQEGYGSADALHVRDVETPAAPADGVLVRVRAASVNAGDWHMVHGGAVVRAVTAAMRVPVPPIRGGDLAGVVEAVGAEVTDLKPGDEVFGVGSGSFAEYATADPQRLAPKPRLLSFEEAAAIPGAGCTALQGLRDVGLLQPGERVLVYGAGGGVGTFAVQVAAALGGRVTAVTGTANVDLVRSLRAGEVIDHTQDDVTRASQLYDVVFDVAAIRSLADLVRILAPGGRLVMAGAAKGGMLALVGRLAAGTVRSKVLRQRVSTFLARVRRDDLLVLTEMVEAGKLRPVIDRRFAGLAEAQEAVRYVGTGTARAKVVISVGDR